MSKQEWLTLYWETSPKFEWFLDQYFWHKCYKRRLNEARGEGRIAYMLQMMSQIWFDLPDNKFNIIENPPGWKEFLYLLENAPECEPEKED